MVLICPQTDLLSPITSLADTLIISGMSLAPFLTTGLTRDHITHLGGVKPFGPPHHTGPPPPGPGWSWLRSGAVQLLLTRRH